MRMVGVVAAFACVLALVAFGVRAATVPGDVVDAVHAHTARSRTSTASPDTNTPRPTPLMVEGRCRS
jgi:hypothetical protein